MINGQFAEDVQRLVRERVPFVLATVVRSRKPTSVRPGDAAVVLADGTITGFVGGVCAESSVRLYSLRALETGEPMLLRLIPGDAADEHDDIEGAVVEHNPCLSGGSLEIFLEPQLPAARMIVAGTSPIAAALERVAGAAGFDVVRSATPSSSDAAVIVASHGADEEAVLAEALVAGVPYVALVASSARGTTVRDLLDVPDELRAQLHTPAGLDIGARTPEEIAVSILAQLIAERHAHPVAADAVAAVAASAARTAIDPICGMSVAVSDASAYLEVHGERVYFCGAGCRDDYAARRVAS